MASINGVSGNNLTSSLYNSANVISGLASGSTFCPKTVVSSDSSALSFLNVSRSSPTSCAPDSAKESYVRWSKVSSSAPNESFSRLS